MEGNESHYHRKVVHYRSEEVHIPYLTYCETEAKTEPKLFLNLFLTWAATDAGPPIKEVKYPLSQLESKNFPHGVPAFSASNGSRLDNDDDDRLAAPCNASQHPRSHQRSIMRIRATSNFVMLRRGCSELCEFSPRQKPSALHSFSGNLIEK